MRSHLFGALVTAVVISCNNDGTPSVDCPLIYAPSFDVSVVDDETGAPVCDLAIIVTTAANGSTNCSAGGNPGGYSGGGGSARTCESSLSCELPVGSYVVHTHAPGYVDASEPVDVVQYACGPRGSLRVRVKKE